MKTSHQSHEEFRLDLERQIVQICRNLHSRNLLAAADGNVSYRISDDEILITPSGVAKAFMQETAMAIINIHGEVVRGFPSGEKQMHLEIYRKCPQAKAVVHAHPPTAIAFSLVNPEAKELPNQALPEVILAAGTIPLVPYTRPGTREMGLHLHPYLPENRALILARHGAVCWGETLDEAYRGMERIEHVALILSKTAAFGHAKELPHDELVALHALRAQLGPKLL